MGTSGIKEFIDKLMKINGKNVWIHIGHEFYGNQNLKCAFRLLNDEKRIGFFSGNQEIYIEKDKIKNIGGQDNLFYFADELMCIKIRKM